MFNGYAATIYSKVCVDPAGGDLKQQPSKLEASTLPRDYRDSTCM